MYNLYFVVWSVPVSGDLLHVPEGAVPVPGPADLALRGLVTELLSLQARYTT